MFYIKAHNPFVIKNIEYYLNQNLNTSFPCRRWRNTSSVGVMLDELEWPSLEALRDQSSLFHIHKIHCGAVFIEKDKYMTPAHRLKTTRSSHSAQYHRHQTYNDALKNFPFSPELLHIGIVCLILWPIPSPQRSLGHSLLKQNSAKSFFVFFCVVFVLFLSCFCFLFYQNFQIRNLWCNAQV